jgi:hypothetical protein
MPKHDTIERTIMTLRMKSWLLVAALLALPVTASATGGLGCAIDDKNAKLDFEAIFSYSDIGGLFQIRGELNVKDARVYKTLKTFAFDGAELKQQWFRGNDLKLMIYRESEGDGVPHASVKLIIEATRPADEEFGYTGRYALTIEPAVEGNNSEAFTLTGDVGCSAG